MFRRTSKSVKEQVDKMRLPAVVRECRRWSDAMRMSTWPDSKKLEIVMNQLPLMTAWCRLTTLEVHGLRDCPRKKTPETFAGVVEGVLGQSEGSLTHVALDSNWIGPDGVRRLAPVLAKCTTLRYLRLSANLYAMRENIDAQAASTDGRATLYANSQTHMFGRKRCNQKTTGGF